MANRYDHRDTYKIRLIISAVSFIIFLLILFLMKAGLTEDIDESVGEAVRSLRGPVQNSVLIAITNMGAWPCLVSIGAALLILNAIKMRKIDYPLAVGACLVNLGLYSILKRVVQRARPDKLLWLLEEHGYSFPSGHTMNSVFCYGMLLYLVRRNVDNEKAKTILTIILAVLPAVIGFTRIYCGVHYLSDVLGAAAMGTSMLMLCTVILDDYLFHYYQRQKQ